MVERALCICLLVIVCLIGCVFVGWFGIPKGVCEIVDSYNVFVQGDDLVESFNEISQSLEGPVV